MTDWKQIPAVPTSAFKDLEIACFQVAGAVAVFNYERNHPGTSRQALLQNTRPL